MNERWVNDIKQKYIQIAELLPPVAQRLNQCLWSPSVCALNTHVIEIYTLFCLCVWCNGKHMHNLALQSDSDSDWHKLHFCHEYEYWIHTLGRWRLH